MTEQITHDIQEVQEVNQEAPQQTMHPMLQAVQQFVNEAFTLPEAQARITFLTNFLTDLDGQVKNIIEAQEIEK